MAVSQFKSILLADDDPDDCFLFQVALDELKIESNFVAVHDGVELMKFLSESIDIPQILFLDLNMPLKSGFECLEEIKSIPRLKLLDVIVLSTFFNSEMFGGTATGWCTNVYPEAERFRYT